MIRVFGGLAGMLSLALAGSPVCAQSTTDVFGTYRELLEALPGVQEITGLVALWRKSL
jgi:hypothetical protein